MIAHTGWKDTKNTEILWFMTRLNITFTKYNGTRVVIKSFYLHLTVVTK